MLGAVDQYQQEKRIANTSVTSLRKAIRNAVDATSKAKSGDAKKKSGARAVFKNQRLQRIAIQAPHYIFKQHYGFEGKKSNNVNMRLRATNVITKALENSNGLETLADEISNIRSQKVESIIRFGNGK